MADRPREVDPEDAWTLAEARRALGVSAPVLRALVVSNLLGPWDPAGFVLKKAVADYQRYGTQWDPDLAGERVLTADFIRSIPPPPEPGGESPPDTGQFAYIAQDEDLEALRRASTGWIAHFYLRPNRGYWPAPTTTGMIEPLLRLRRPKEVRGAALPTKVWPDPEGCLALATVTAVDRPLDPTPKALEQAYDVVAPVLDELSAKYDQPLPVAHTLLVGIPTGLFVVPGTKIPPGGEIDVGEEISPACPHPELREAVALYREAASSTNPFHSFLAFWKTYENLVEVKSKWRSEHRRPTATVQQEFFTDAFGFGESKNLAFEEAKQRLERPYRVALAHGGFIRQGGRPRTAGTAKDLRDVSSQVPTIRYMARTLLANMRATLSS